MAFMGSCPGELVSARAEFSRLVIGSSSPADMPLTSAHRTLLQDRVPISRLLPCSFDYTVRMSHDFHVWWNVISGYVALELFEKKGGRELERDLSTEIAMPAGDEWAEDDLPHRFPSLAKKYGFEAY